MLERWKGRLAAHTRFGIAAALLAAAKRVLQPLVEVGSVVIVEMPVPRGAPVPGVREVARADVPLLTRTFDPDADELEARFDRGDRGFAIFERGELLSIRWITVAPTEIPECGLWLCPGPAQVYVYDAVTVPAVRGGGHLGAVRDHMDHTLSHEGITSKVLYVRADNHAMWRALAKGPGPVRRLMRIGYVKPRGRAPIAVGAYRPPVFRSPTVASGSLSRT